jgi:hypothetical protein
LTPVCVTLLAVTFTLCHLSTRCSFYVCHIPILLVTLQCLLDILNPSFQKFVENCSLLKLLLSGPAAIFGKRLLFLSSNRCAVKANPLFNVSQTSPEIVCQIRSPPCTHGAKPVAQQRPVSPATMNPTLLGATKPLSGKCVNVAGAGRWALSVSSENMPQRCNQWDLSDRLLVTLCCT